MALPNRNELGKQFSFIVFISSSDTQLHSGYNLTVRDDRRQGWVVSYHTNADK